MDQLIGVIVGSIITVSGSFLVSYFTNKQEDRKNLKLQRLESSRIRYILTAHHNFLHSEQLSIWLDKKGEEEDLILLLECGHYESEIRNLNLDKFSFVLDDHDPNIIDKVQRSIRLFHGLLSTIQDHASTVKKAHSYPGGDMSYEYEYKLTNIHEDLQTLYEQALKANEEAKSMYFSYFEKNIP